MSATANSIKALEESRVPWTSETAPRRKNAGLSVNEWRNVYAGYTSARLNDVFENPDSTSDQLIAAREIKDAIDGNINAKRDLCDYTNGKPNQKNEIEQDTTIRVIIEHIDAGYSNSDTETPLLPSPGSRAIKAV